MKRDEDKYWHRLAHIHREAIRAGYFLYNKGSGHWLTPEEFEAKYAYGDLSNTQVVNLLESVVIRDPIAGINAAHRQLNTNLARLMSETDRERVKLEEFSKKTLQYYQAKLKK